jgi:hypothetical protein
MKTSDKLLLGFSLASVGLFGVLHLVKYAEYKSGNILDENKLHEEQFNRFSMSRPRYLSLRGTLWVNIFPSDSCYVEFPKKPIRPGDGFFERTKNEPDPALPRYQQKGDTLVIDGNNNLAIHRPFADAGYETSVPVVNVYCRGLREISVNYGEVMLKGAGSDAAPVAARLRVDNSTLWIGDRIFTFNELPMVFNQHPREEYAAKEEFDSLAIESENSIILLNGSAHVRSLHIRLDKGSELNDQLGSVEQLTIGYNRDSRINLGGNNLKKAQFSIY